VAITGKDGACAQRAGQVPQINKMVEIFAPLIQALKSGSFR